MKTKKSEKIESALRLMEQERMHRNFLNDLKEFETYFALFKLMKLHEKEKAN